MEFSEQEPPKVSLKLIKLFFIIIEKQTHTSGSTIVSQEDKTLWNR